MYAPKNVKISPDMPIPERMRAWVLGDPNELKQFEKLVPVPGRAEILVRIDAVAIVLRIWKSSNTESRP